jgi:hypothetical protein
VDFRQVQADILALLADSPITSTSVMQDIKESVQAGELSLAFDTLCSWLYEDSLPISRAFYERLTSLAAELEEPRAVQKMHELITD